MYDNKTLDYLVAIFAEQERIWIILNQLHYMDQVPKLPDIH